MAWTLQDAKNKFSAVVEAALHEQPQYVTRRGKPAVVVLSTNEYERLRKLEVKDKMSFKEFLCQPLPGLDEYEDIERINVKIRDIDF